MWIVLRNFALVMAIIVASHMLLSDKPVGGLGGVEKMPSDLYKFVFSEGSQPTGSSAPTGVFI